MHIDRCSRRRMDRLGPTIDTDVRLHPTVPLAALLGLVHLRVPFPGLGVGRTRALINYGIHNGASSHLRAALLKVLGNQGKQPPPMLWRTSR